MIIHLRTELQFHRNAVWFSSFRCFLGKPQYITAFKPLNLFLLSLSLLLSFPSISLLLCIWLQSIIQHCFHGLYKVIVYSLISYLFKLRHAHCPYESSIMWSYLNKGRGICLYVFGFIHAESIVDLDYSTGEHFKIIFIFLAFSN